jgi:hypothetical protein
VSSIVFDALFSLSLIICSSQRFARDGFLKRSLDPQGMLSSVAISAQETHYNVLLKEVFAD